MQSSHPSMSHVGPRAMQSRNARSALGGPAIGANSAVLSLHPAGETAESSPPSVFSHLDWLSRIFCSFLQQRIARVSFHPTGSDPFWQSLTPPPPPPLSNSHQHR